MARTAIIPPSLCSSQSTIAFDANEDVTQQVMELAIQALQYSDCLETSLLQLTRILGEAFKVDTCWIGINDCNNSITQTTRWQPPDTVTFTQADTLVLHILRHPAIEANLSRAQSVVISDLQALNFIPYLESTTDPAVSELKDYPAIRAVLILPTWFQGSINGMIVLTRSCVYQWTESDIQLLRSISAQVAIAIAQVRLEQQLQQRTRYQTLFDRLVKAIQQSRELGPIFQMALEGLVSTLQVTRGFILLLKYTKPPLGNHTTSHHSHGTKVIVECQYPLACEVSSSPLITELLADPESDPCIGSWTKQTFWVSDCQLCQQLLADAAKPLAISTYPYSPHSQIHQSLPTPQQFAPIFDFTIMPSLLSVPLENQGTVLGYVVLQHQHYRPWSQEEFLFVQSISTQLSTAIIQNRTLRQVQSLVDERTAQLQRSLDVQAKLYTKTRQQVNQLRRLNQIMEEFLSTMSHELRTPLTSMTLAIRMLKQAEISPQMREKYLDILEQQCAQEIHLINDLLALQQLETGAAILQFQPLDIRQLVLAEIESFETKWAKKHLMLEVKLPERPLLIHTDSQSLSQILAELLLNAGKYADPNTTVRLELEYKADYDVSQVCLSLSNIGAGITSEEIPYIFEKFRRGKGATQQAVPGTGLGLALVKGLIEHLSGAIAVSSVPLPQSSSWETRFTVTLPQSPNLYVS
jgi:signal transduction histidine kinase